MVNVTLWPDVWARLRGVVRRHALLLVDGDLQRESVVNLVAREVRPLIEVAASAGAPGAAERRPPARHGRDAADGIAATSRLSPGPRASAPASGAARSSSGPCRPGGGSSASRGGAGSGFGSVEEAAVPRPERREDRRQRNSRGERVVEQERRSSPRPRSAASSPDRPRPRGVPRTGRPRTPGPGTRPTQARRAHRRGSSLEVRTGRRRTPCRTARRPRSNRRRRRRWTPDP